MKTRSISRLLYGQEVDMGGLPVRQPFPTQSVDQVDPFLLLHHADVRPPSHVEPRHAGVGPHPHRGFSPVTFVFKGGVHHRDSRGNDSIIYAGGAQWMNAGMGIIHSERPPHDIAEHGGQQEIIQLWINTPSAHKMDPPAYFPLSGSEVPVWHSPDGNATLSLYSGKLMGLTGPIPSHSDVNAATSLLRPGGVVEIPFPNDHNVIVYLLDGSINVAGFGLVEAFHAALFSNDGEGIRLEGREETRLLILSGKPLREKVVSHGPFVMNTQTEILEAMRDYQMGRMGILIED